jgi:hypothetical protein
MRRDLESKDQELVAMRRDLEAKGRSAEVSEQLEVALKELQICQQQVSVCMCVCVCVLALLLYAA